MKLPLTFNEFLHKGKQFRAQLVAIEEEKRSTLITQTALLDPQALSSAVISNNRVSMYLKSATFTASQQVHILHACAALTCDLISKCTGQDESRNYGAHHLFQRQIATISAAHTLLARKQENSAELITILIGRVFFSLGVKQYIDNGSLFNNDCANYMNAAIHCKHLPALVFCFFITRISRATNSPINELRSVIFGYKEQDNIYSLNGEPVIYESALCSIPSIMVSAHNPLISIGNNHVNLHRMSSLMISTIKHVSGFRTAALFNALQRIATQVLFRHSSSHEVLLQQAVSAIRKTPIRHSPSQVTILRYMFVCNRLFKHYFSSAKLKHISQILSQQGLCNLLLLNPNERKIVEAAIANPTPARATKRNLLSSFCATSDTSDIQARNLTAPKTKI